MEGAQRRKPQFAPPNGPDAKLRDRGPRAEVRAARRLPPMTFAEPSGDLQAA
jgi:hypothetical protein